MLAPVWVSVPPEGYGGIELVVSLLADGLIDQGHDVTLFASGGSETKATLVSPLVDPPDPALLGNPWFDAYHALSSYLAISDEFDVVHDHSGIAERLWVTPKTVETHVRHILRKLDLPAGTAHNRRVHAVLAYLRS